MTEYNLNPTFGDPPSEDALGVPALEGPDTAPSFSGTYIDPKKF